MSEYPYEITIPVRFRDIDAMGHVNNAVYATFLEQTRVEFFHDVVGVDLDEAGLVIASLEIDYERPIEYGSTVTVGMRIPELGTTSMPLEYVIRADNDVVATAETQFVHVDPGSGKPSPLPEDWRERIQAHHQAA